MTFLERHVLITPSASLQNVQFIFTQCFGDSQKRHEFVLEHEVEEGWGAWEMVVLLEILVTTESIISSFVPGSNACKGWGWLWWAEIHCEEQKETMECSWCAFNQSLKKHSEDSSDKTKSPGLCKTGLMFLTSTAGLKIELCSLRNSFGAASNSPFASVPEHL